MSDFGPWGPLVDPKPPAEWAGPATRHELYDEPSGDEPDTPPARQGRPAKWQPWAVVTPANERSLLAAVKRDPGWPLLKVGR